ncbi:MAG: nitroreductase/quinone reductase family protein [Actinomycetota bacterium]
MTEPTSDPPKSPFLPPRWVIRNAWRIHRGLFRLSRGRFGLRRPSIDTYGLMWVTVTGRRSGQPRPVMLGYFDDGPNLVTMAMNGWGAPEPQWWLNLQADPAADVRLVDGTQSMIGRAAEGEERDRLWARWAEIDDGLDGYASRRPTETAVVVFEPQER